MMIPGTWEPRRRSGAVVEPLTSASKQPAESRVANGSGADTQRTELPSWLKASIFTATLVVAMWLAMAVFYEGATR